MGIFNYIDLFMECICENVLISIGLSYGRNYEADFISTNLARLGQNVGSLPKDWGIYLYGIDHKEIVAKF